MKEVWSRPQWFSLLFVNISACVREFLALPPAISSQWEYDMKSFDPWMTDNYAEDFF